MAKIKIEPSKAKAVLGRQDSLENTLKELCQDVDSIRSGLRYKIAGQENISQRLREVAEQITREQQSTGALRSGLEEIILLYEQSEGKNRDLVAAEKMSIQENSGVEKSTIEEYLSKLFEGIMEGKPLSVLGALSLISPGTALLYLASGIPFILDTSTNTHFSGGLSGLGYELSESNPGVTAWVGKASGKAEGDWGNVEVNGYVGKVEAETKAEFKFMEFETEKKYQDGEWTNREDSWSFVDAELGIGVTGSLLAGDAKSTIGTDNLGTEIELEGGLGNATLEGAGEFSIGDDGVNANLSGKAMISAAEGEASGTINILGFEITGKVGGYAGAVGGEGKVGIEDNKFVIEGGAAALLGVSFGVEIGFNDQGWSDFLDLITFGNYSADSNQATTVVSRSGAGGGGGRGW